MQEIISVINLILLFIGILFLVYLQSYFKQKANNLASREEFQELSEQLKENTRATEEIKATIYRAEAAKSTGADLIIEKMAEIESLLVSWRMLIYFRADKLENNETIEDLGRKELKVIAEKILDLNKLISKYNIYFSDNLMLLAFEWSKKVYDLLYDYEAAYRASIAYHHGKNAIDSVRVTWLSQLFQNEIDPTTNKLGELKKVFNEKLIEELQLVNKYTT